MLYELSTPLLNISKENHKNNRHDIYAVTIEILFLVVFTLVRIFFGSYLLINLLPILFSLDYPSCLIIFVPMTVQILNYYWWYKIVKMIYRTRILGLRKKYD